jgi:methylase of polypeptide subunit release factors
MNNPISKNWQWPEASKYISSISVFDPPSLFTKTISEIIPIKSGFTRLLDIGCGCGIIGIYCLIKKKTKLVTFNDIQDAAILETRANVAMHIEQGAIHESQVAGHRGSFTTIPPSIITHHDLIAFNPPQLPTGFINKEHRKKIEADSSMSLFRIGGPDGLKIVKEFFTWYAMLKPPKPAAIIVLSSFLGRNLIKKKVEEHCLKWEILKETQVPLREILNDAADKFSKDNAELSDRSLERNFSGGFSAKWSKKLLTIEIKSIN